MEFASSQNGFPKANWELQSCTNPRNRGWQAPTSNQSLLYTIQTQFIIDLSTDLPINKQLMQVKYFSAGGGGPFS